MSKYEETNAILSYSLTNESSVNSGSYPIYSHTSFLSKIAHGLSPLLHIPLRGNKGHVFALTDQ